MENEDDFFKLVGRINPNSLGGGFTPIGGSYVPGLEQNPEWQAATIGLMNEQRNYLSRLNQNSQFGLNLNTFNNVMGGLSSLAQLWQGYQASKLAKDQWRTQKSVLNTNMMNQIQSYNNSLRDRLDSRAKMEGRDQASADRQFEERKARRY
ncbi:hypothetical protein ZC03_017 [Pseudomonas phage ZC03]|uniref:Uncharacterized protein n=2 Tax=Zicotriavirus TaxID=2843161 RepID=A0A1L2C923_9CAUD|nr:hypothetical protein HWA93_gp17 [Pseudomonas phage ZC03]YP_009830588.1 hypothetical protein HWA94_gp17 [Pseudomonas phage ZC08]AMD43404.1 hypothetical protein ZC03_017 [Pseudomonas phage ZC03]AMD43539.1 hypothetical protein ZC08_017 [Pseudomonas phage ZC08]